MTLAEAQALVLSQYSNAVFSAAENHSRYGSAVQLVRWVAGDGSETVSGLITVIGADAFVDLPDPIDSHTAALHAWVTDYDNRPWAMVLRIYAMQRDLKVALVDAISPTDANNATIDVHAVAFLGGAFVSRKLSNVTPNVTP